MGSGQPPLPKKDVDFFLVVTLSASAGKGLCRDAREGKHRKDIRCLVAKHILNLGAPQVAKRQAVNYHALSASKHALRPT